MPKIEFAFRWLHVYAGITWIGFLYFFNFVNVPLQASLDDAAKKAVNPQMMPRVLWWFRWGAMVTFLSGLILFTSIFFYTPGVGFGPNALLQSAEGGLADRARWIMWGMLFGSVMWFNVWRLVPSVATRRPSTCLASIPPVSLAGQAPQRALPE